MYGCIHVPPIETDTANSLAAFIDTQQQYGIYAQCTHMGVIRAFGRWIKSNWIVCESLVSKLFCIRLKCTERNLRYQLIILFALINLKVIKIV